MNEKFLETWKPLELHAFTVYAKMETCRDKHALLVLLADFLCRGLIKVDERDQIWLTQRGRNHQMTNLPEKYMLDAISEMGGKWNQKEAVWYLREFDFKRMLIRKGCMVQVRRFELLPWPKTSCLGVNFFRTFEQTRALKKELDDHLSNRIDPCEQLPYALVFTDLVEKAHRLEESPTMDGIKRIMEGIGFY
jgi:hypothetical protein